MSLINSAALKYSDALKAYVIQCCGTCVHSVVVQKLPSTVTKDAGRLVGLMGFLDSLLLFQVFLPSELLEKRRVKFQLNSMQYFGITTYYVNAKLS